MNPPTLFDAFEHPHRVAYDKFVEANPWVLPRLAHLARGMKNHGLRHYGIAPLVEVLRYEYHMTNDPSSEWKINNNYRAFLARDLMRLYPELDGFFDTRKSVADEK